MERCLVRALRSSSVGSVCGRGGKRDIFMGRSLGGGRPLRGLFPCLYHLSSLKNHFVAVFCMEWELLFFLLWVLSCSFR